MIQIIRSCLPAVRRSVTVYVSLSFGFATFYILFTGLLAEYLRLVVRLEKEDHELLGF